jgi:hypothetical protein
VLVGTQLQAMSERTDGRQSHWPSSKHQSRSELRIRFRALVEALLCFPARIADGGSWPSTQTLLIPARGAVGCESRNLRRPFPPASNLDRHDCGAAPVLRSTDAGRVVTRVVEVVSGVKGVVRG